MRWSGASGDVLVPMAPKASLIPRLIAPLMIATLWLSPKRGKRRHEQREKGKPVFSGSAAIGSAAPFFHSPSIPSIPSIHFLLPRSGTFSQPPSIDPCRVPTDSLLPTLTQHCRIQSSSPCRLALPCVFVAPGFTALLFAIFDHPSDF